MPDTTDENEDRELIDYEYEITQTTIIPESQLQEFLEDNTVLSYKVYEGTEDDS